MFRQVLLASAAALIAASCVNGAPPKPAQAAAPRFDAKTQGYVDQMLANSYQIRTGNYPEAPISVYFTVRQYWGRQPFKNFVESYRNQRKICQELVDNHIIPAIIRPLAQTIAAKQ